MNTSIVRIIFIFQWDFKSEWEFAYNGIRPTSIISPFFMLIEHAIIWTAVHGALRLHNTSWLSQNDIGHASRLIPNLAPNLIYRELIVHVVARCAVCGVRCVYGGHRVSIVFPLFTAIYIQMKIMRFAREFL